MPTNKITTTAVRKLWRNWAVAFGTPALVTGASLLVPPIWLPLICMIMAYMLLITYRKRTQPGFIFSGCGLVAWLTMVAMATGAVIMAMINIIYSPKVLPTVVAENPALPFITSLVLYPLMCAVSLYGLLMEQENKCCRRCQATHGYYPGESAVSSFYFRESRYQLRLCLSLSALVSIVATAYYFIYYVNVNLNSPDRFFFVVMPLVLYVLSLLYMTIRYFRIHDAVENDRRSGVSLQPRLTMVRFLVFDGDSLLLQATEGGDWDTPLFKVIDHADAIDDNRARNMVEDELPDTEFTLRLMYTNGGHTGGANVIHYAVILPENSGVLPMARRCTINDIQRLLRNGILSPYVINELYRIHTITMAWKTYDRNGRRLYPIRNYRPTFRFRDLKDWDVDYNDTSWIQVANNNEDRPLYRIRRFINRYLLFQSHN